MKKHRKKLHLEKTTLRNLTLPPRVAMGASDTGDTNGCATGYTDAGCTSSACDTINEFTCGPCAILETANCTDAC